MRNQADRITMLQQFGFCLLVAACVLNSVNARRLGDQSQSTASSEGTTKELVEKIVGYNAGLLVFVGCVIGLAICRRYCPSVADILLCQREETDHVYELDRQKAERSGILGRIFRQ